MKYCKIDGKLLVFRNIKFHAKFFYPVVWRNDWLKDIGYTKAPDNMKEVEDVLYKFVKK